MAWHQRALRSFYFIEGILILIPSATMRVLKCELNISSRSKPTFLESLVPSCAGESATCIIPSCCLTACASRFQRLRLASPLIANVSICSSAATAMWFHRRIYRRRRSMIISNGFASFWSAHWKVCTKNWKNPRQLLMLHSKFMSNATVSQKSAFISSPTASQRRPLRTTSQLTPSTYSTSFGTSKSCIASSFPACSRKLLRSTLRRILAELFPASPATIALANTEHSSRSSPAVCSQRYMRNTDLDYSNEMYAHFFPRAARSIERFGQQSYLRHIVFWHTTMEFLPLLMRSNWNRTMDR